MPPTCTIRLLGAFEVEVNGRVVPAAPWRRRKAAEVVKLLALAPGHRLHREQMMEALWPDLAPDAAAANLRKAAHFARRALGSESSIAAQEGMVVLWPDGGIVTDVEEFETAARDALRSLDRGACADAATLYGGDLLPEDRYAAWSEETRQRLRLRYLEVLRAGEMWERVLEVDRSDEDAHRALMRAHLEAGNRHGAMRQFERLRDALRADLGVAPDPESVALYEKVLAMEGHEPPTPAERARALLAWGLVHWNRRDLEEAERTAEAARALAVEAELGRELGEASALLGLVAHARGRWRDVFRSEFLESMRRAPRLASFVFDAHLCLAEFSLYGVGWQDDVAPFAQELFTLAEEAGSVHGQALATLMLGEVELLAGRLDAAERSLARATTLHEGARATSGLTLSLVRQAEAALAQGRRWRAGRTLRRALGLAREDPLAPHLLVRVYSAIVQAAPDATRARSAVTEAEEALAGQDVCEPCSMGFHVAVATTSARGGDPERARRHVEDAERIAGMWQGGPWLASVWELRGTLRAAEGDPVQAAALFREAADLFARAGRPLDEARCRAAASQAV